MKSGIVFFNKCTGRVEMLDEDQPEEMYNTLQSVRDQYCIDLSLGNTNKEFEVYLKESYQQVYDENLNFIGYARI